MRLLPLHAVGVQREKIPISFPFVGNCVTSDHFVPQRVGTCQCHAFSFNDTLGYRMEGEKLIKLADTIMISHYTHHPHRWTFSNLQQNPSKRWHCALCFSMSHVPWLLMSLRKKLHYPHASSSAIWCKNKIVRGGGQAGWEANWVHAEYTF